MSIKLRMKSAYLMMWISYLSFAESTSCSFPAPVISRRTPIAPVSSPSPDVPLALPPPSAPVQQEGVELLERMC
eukprot:Em0004g721a